jgi:two-component system, NarL family, nitrate/nitrite response regulator NarL
MCSPVVDKPFGIREPLEVAILVNHEVIHQGLVSMLAEDSNCTVVRQRGIPHEWRKVENDRPKVVIFGLAEWREISPVDLPVVTRRPLVLLVGDNIHSQDISERPDLPLDGVLALGNLTSAKLSQHLSQVISGDLPMPMDLTRELLATSRGQVHRATKGVVALTAREKETLNLLVQGCSNKQIARALGISGHGAKRLVGAILLKLNAPNRTTAVIIAMNDGLV